MPRALPAPGNFFSLISLAITNYSIKKNSSGHNILSFLSLLIMHFCIFSSFLPFFLSLSLIYHATVSSCGIRCDIYHAKNLECLPLFKKSRKFHAEDNQQVFLSNLNFFLPSKLMIKTHHF